MEGMVLPAIIGLLTFCVARLFYDVRDLRRRLDGLSR